MSPHDIELEEQVVVADPVASPFRVHIISNARAMLTQGTLLLCVSLAAIGINGYHPFGEDAGIYVAGIKQARTPGLYGTSSDFISPYFRLSLFTNWNAWVVRSLHLPLEDVLFSMHILTTWLLLYACWKLACQCFDSAAERWAAVLLVAACLSVPVAGSSLFMADPYLTGRSFSTPLTLLALSACLELKVFQAVAFLLLVTLFHPLMSIYGIGFVLVLWAIRRRSWAGIAGLGVASLAMGAAIQYSQRLVVESAAYEAAVGSRYYYFLYRWHWYELIGIAAPLLMLSIFWVWQRRTRQRDSLTLSLACIAIGIISITVSLLFARPDSHSHLISALQTIRPFLFIYFWMFLLLGGLLGRFLLKRVAWRWVVFFGSVGVILAILQHQAYPASAQVEFPWATSQNGWKRAFMWIRDNTPGDGVVALDANYIHARGEDSQGFRAIAERNSLADHSKDGGAAAAFPQLAERWMREQTATTGLNAMDDATRLRNLEPFHVSWVVLETSARTTLLCPFADDVVKVCRLQ